ncbi:MAG TPA: hypothetical protein VFC67_08925 [Prolixibacteraceae bacterium]|nr:hypothetical protein [Prolixibacteraceae bacterium]
MKTLQKITLFIAIVALFASCQPNNDVNKILANQETKTAIMNNIANDSILSVEMMETMMNSENSTMMMLNQRSMMKMMQNNPSMMQSMMNGMFETCYRDTAMMNSMYSSIMNNPRMMDMLHKNGSGNMSTKGMNHMEGMNQTTK